MIAKTEIPTRLPDAQATDTRVIRRLRVRLTDRRLGGLPFREYVNILFQDQLFHISNGKGAKDED
jgi:hypothetical protein